MNSFPDISFLCALYQVQDQSEQALAFRTKMVEPLAISRLLLWEFRQAARLQAFRHTKDRTKGYSLKEAEKMIADLTDDIRDGFVQVRECDLLNVLVTAERVSKSRTFSGGHRSFDVLHVATAFELDAREFLSFDSNQNALAATEGLATPLHPL